MVQNIYINAPQRRGCLSQIIRGVFIALALIVGIPLLIAFLSKRGDNNSQVSPPVTTGSPGIPPAVTAPDVFIFVKGDTEDRSDGYVNVMDVYTYDGPIDRDQLIQLCQAQKERMKDSKLSVYFYVLVLFDKPENVVQSTTPITSAFSLQESAEKHIRAKYTFNKMNGFSELQWHEKNTWEHKPNTEKL